MTEWGKATETNSKCTGIVLCNCPFVLPVRRPTKRRRWKSEKDCNKTSTEWNAIAVHPVISEMSFSAEKSSRRPEECERGLQGFEKSSLFLGQLKHCSSALSLALGSKGPKRELAIRWLTAFIVSLSWKWGMRMAACRLTKVLYLTWWLLNSTPLSISTNVHCLSDGLVAFSGSLAHLPRSLSIFNALSALLIPSISMVFLWCSAHSSHCSQWAHIHRDIKRSWLIWPQMYCHNGCAVKVNYWTLVLGQCARIGINLLDRVLKRCHQQTAVHFIYLVSCFCLPFLQLNSTFCLL